MSEHDWTKTPEGIPGAQQLFDYFGYWPTFHDAEIIELNLRRTGSSSIVLHTFGMTREIDSSGHYVLTNHAIVRLILDGITDLSLNDFSIQNVVNGIVILRTDNGFQVEMAPCYGVCGTIDASGVRVEFEPGVPSDTISCAKYLDPDRNG